MSQKLDPGQQSPTSGHSHRTKAYLGLSESGIPRANLKICQARVMPQTVVVVFVETASSGRRNHWSDDQLFEVVEICSSDSSVQLFIAIGSLYFVRTHIDQTEL